MKVTETLQYFDSSGQPQEVTDMDWCRNADSLDVIGTVAAILNHQRLREAGEVENFPGRIKTLAIHIEL